MTGERFDLLTGEIVLAPTFQPVDVTGWAPEDVAELMFEDEDAVDAWRATTAAAVPQPHCPAWCERTHRPAGDTPVPDDDGPGEWWVHEHVTSTPDAGWVVAVTAWESLGTGDVEPAAVYVDALKVDDITPDAARAMAAALVAAAAIAEGWG